MESLEIVKKNLESGDVVTVVDKDYHLITKEQLETIKKDLEILQIFKKNISYEVDERTVKVRDDENDYEYYENELTPYIAIEIHNPDTFEIVNDWDIEQSQKEKDNS